MRIGFVTDSISKELTGVGRYAKALLLRLDLLGQHLVPIDWRRSLWEKMEFESIRIRNPWPLTRNLLWHAFLLRGLGPHTGRLDLVFDPSQFPHPFGKLYVPMVYVVHDVSFMRHPECHRRGKKTLFRLFFRTTLKKADRIVCPSHHTRKELLNYFQPDPAKIRVVYEASESRFQPIRQDQLLERVRRTYRLPRAFFLSVGTIEPRKNLHHLFEAYAGGKIPYPLYLAGKPGWRSNPLITLHKRLRLESRVHFLGYVPEDDLPALYNLATALVYVSKDEGFGLPPLEAMQCGTPVIVSRAGSLPEIVGDAGLFVSERDPGQIAETLIAICEHPELRKELRKKGLRRAGEFSWEKSARRLLEVFKELI